MDIRICRRWSYERYSLIEILWRGILEHPNSKEFSKIE